MNAIEEAQKVYDNVNAKQDEVQNQITALTAAINAYETAKQQGNQAAPQGKEDLANAILRANNITLAKISVDGTDIIPTDYWVTQAQEDAFKLVLNDAQTIFNDSTAQGINIEDATTNLLNAIVVYEDAKKPGLYKIETTEQLKYVELRASEVEQNADLGGILSATSTPEIQFTTVELGIGQIIKADILDTNPTNDIFTVPENSVLTFDFSYYAQAVLGFGSADLIVAKKDSNGDFAPVWTRQVNFFSLLGAPIQNQYDFSVPNLEAGEYILVASPRDNLDVGLIATKRIEIGSKTLINNTSSINKSIDAVTKGVTGALTADTAIKVKEVNGVAFNSTTTELVLSGRYGQLEIDETGEYTYKSYGNPKSIGKVDVFTYTLINPSNGAQVTEKIYIRTGLVNENLSWSAQDYEQPVSLITSLNNQAETVSLNIETIDNKTYTTENLQGGNLFGGFKALADFDNPLEFDLFIESADTVIAFQPSVDGTEQKVKYEIVDYEGNVYYEETLQFSGDLTQREIHGLDVGAYILRLTPLQFRRPLAVTDSLDGYRFGVMNLKASKTNWRPQTLTENILKGANYLLEDYSYLYVDNQIILNAKTEVMGKYGKLIISPDGSYDYTPNATLSSMNKKEVFEYTIVSPNGDSMTKQLEISVTGTVVPIPKPVENGSMIYNAVKKTSTVAPFIFSFNDEEELRVVLSVNFNG